MKYSKYTLLIKYKIAEILLRMVKEKLLFQSKKQTISRLDSAKSNAAFNSSEIGIKIMLHMGSDRRHVQQYRVSK